MKKIPMTAIAAVSMVAASIAMAGPANASDAGSPAVLVDEMTGSDAVTDTAAQWQVEGTDLGIMWDDGEGGVLTAFGDTFGDWSGNGGGGGDWRSNVLLRSTDTDLSDGISFDWANEDADGHAGEIVPSKKVNGEEMTTIPTAGISIDGRQYMSYMSVKEWGDPGKWTTNFAKIVYSDDDGKTWNVSDGPQWDNNSEGTSPFQMFAFERHGGYLYVFGTPNGRFGAASLARVPENDVLDKDAYEYWSGSQWSDDIADLKPIVPPNVAELSVHYDEDTGLWLMVYLNEDVDIVMRTAKDPTGDWSDPQIIASSADYPGLYGGFIHPWSPSGELYFAMSIWGPYNVAMMKVDYDSDGNVIHPNLLADPSFERTSAFDDSSPWQAQGNGGIDDNIAWAKLGVHEFWLRNNTGNGELAQTVAVKAHTNYQLTCWLRTGGADAPGALIARPAPQVSGDQPMMNVEFSGLEGWNKITGTFDSGTNTSIAAAVTTSFENGDRWVQGDDCSLVEIGPADEENPPADDDANAAADNTGDADQSGAGDEANADAQNGDTSSSAGPANNADASTSSDGDGSNADSAADATEAGSDTGSNTGGTAGSATTAGAEDGTHGATATADEAADTASANADGELPETGTSAAPALALISAAALLVGLVLLRRRAAA